MYPNKPRMEALSQRNSREYYPKEIVQITGARWNHPRPRKARVAAVAEDSREETSQQASQRPLAWTFAEDKVL